MDSKWIPWVVVLGLAGYSGVVTTLYSHESISRRLAESNEKAALDTTRISLVGQLLAVSRLAVQKDIKLREVNGALEKALKSRGSDVRLVQNLQITIDSLQKRNQIPVRDSTIIGPTGDTTRVAEFKFDGPPIQGEQTVTVPPLPKPITLDSKFRVTPFRVRYALGCDRDHTPVTTFESPNWIKVSFDPGTVSPDVCNPHENPFSFSLVPSVSKVTYFGIGLGLGYLIFK